MHTGIFRISIETTAPFTKFVVCVAALDDSALVARTIELSYAQAFSIMGSSRRNGLPIALELAKLGSDAFANLRFTADEIQQLGLMPPINMLQ